MKESMSAGVFKKRMQDMDGEKNWPEGWSEGPLVSLELGPKPPGNKRLRSYTLLLEHQKRQFKKKQWKEPTTTRTHLQNLTD
jgi:hypothetical protein